MGKEGVLGLGGKGRAQQQGETEAAHAPGGCYTSKKNYVLEDTSSLWGSSALSACVPPSTERVPAAAAGAVVPRTSRRRSSQAFCDDSVDVGLMWGLQLEAAERQAIRGEGAVLRSGESLCP